MNIQQFNNIVEAMTSEMEGSVVMSFIQGSATNAFYLPTWLGAGAANNVFLATCSNAKTGEWAIMASRTQNGINIDFVAVTGDYTSLNDCWDNALLFKEYFRSTAFGLPESQTPIYEAFKKTKALPGFKAPSTGGHASDTKTYPLLVIEQPKTIN